MRKTAREISSSLPKGSYTLGVLHPFLMCLVGACTRSCFEELLDRVDASLLVLTCGENWRHVIRCTAEESLAIHISYKPLRSVQSFRRFRWTKNMNVEGSIIYIPACTGRAFERRHSVTVLRGKGRKSENGKGVRPLLTHLWR